MKKNDKYKIRLNRPAPSAPEIAAHQNFDRVLRQYRRSQRKRMLHQPTGRLGRLLPLLLLFLMMALAAVFFGRMAKKKQAPPPAPKPSLGWQAPARPCWEPPV